MGLGLEFAVDKADNVTKPLARAEYCNSPNHINGKTVRNDVEGHFMDVQKQYIIPLVIMIASE